MHDAIMAPFHHNVILSPRRELEGCVYIPDNFMGHAVAGGGYEGLEPGADLDGFGEVG